MPHVDVVIVTHQTRGEALDCLDTLEAAGADGVWLVDSGSTDGTVADVHRAFPAVRVIALDNVGYGRAANVGVNASVAPYVVIANADTRFAPGSIAALGEDLDAHPGAGAAGPLVRYPDGRLQASARRFPTIPQAVGHAFLGLWFPANPWTRAYRMLDEDPFETKEVDWLSGCALALRREAFADVGGFDPRYFMFVEDVDLGYRLRRAGWTIRYVPSGEIVHRVGASTRRRRAAMVVEHARSLERFYASVYESGPGMLLRPFVRLGLMVWIAIVLVWGAIVGVRRGSSSTGE